MLISVLDVTKLSKDDILCKVAFLNALLAFFSETMEKTSA